MPVSGTGSFFSPVSEQLTVNCFDDIYEFLKSGLRQVHHERNTNETQISISLNMDGTGKAAIHTGLGFFDHMLDQIARHGKMDLGAKAIYFKSGLHELSPEQEALFKEVIVLETDSWEAIYQFLKSGLRQVHHERNTNETQISISLNMDGTGRSEERRVGKEC